MSFFKDFKDDLSQAVNELMPEEKTAEAAPQMVDTITETENTVSEADELASLLATLDMEVVNEAAAENTSAPIDIPVYTESVNVAAEEKTPIEPIFAEAPKAEEPAKTPVAPIFAPEEPKVEEAKAPVEPIFAPDPEPVVAAKEPVKPVFAENNTVTRPINTANMSVGVIPEGMTIVGDITSDGSLEVSGVVKGNISIAGKLDVTGTIEGNSKAIEVFANGAKIIGEISTDGSVKIGDSSVIKGNISATSAVLAGAVKGDIDVKGPVVLDSTAIIMGNIKSKSIQINNGAAIEGLCSQCYADNSPVNFFTED